MDTTTNEGGSQGEQPTTEAVDADKGAQVIGTDENGTPALEPSGAEEAAPDETEQVEEGAQAAADSQEFDVEAYAKKKGIDLEKADPKTLVKMQYEAEKRMHQATEKARELETTMVNNVPVDYTGDPQQDSLAQAVNTLLIQNNVNSFFQSNPEAREFETTMAEIVQERPHLSNDLDALYALAKNSPSREAELKESGGRQALENLAQKQSQVPPGIAATNSSVYESAEINPRNVYDLVDKNDQEWFEKNHAAISKAMSGK